MTDNQFQLSFSARRVLISLNPKAGAKFIDNLGPVTSSLKGQGRFIFRAWAESRGVAEGAANKAIDTATREFYKRSQKQSFSRVA